MNALARFWDRLWFERFDPISVGVFRIALGTLILVQYAGLYPNWERNYGPDGIPSYADLDPAAFPRDSWDVFRWTEGAVPIRAWWWVGLASAVLLTLGCATRPATVALFLLQTSMNHSNRMMVNGEDLVIRMLLFYGLFAPLNHCLALDNLLWRRPTSHRPLIWATRLLQINLALVYAISLPFKLADDVAWWDGTAIYYTLANPTWSRFPWPVLFAGDYGSVGWFLSAAGTYGTVVIEGAFPLLVWFPRWRLRVLLPLVALHVGIAVCLQNVTFFTLSMVCGLWVFVPPETTRAWGSWLARRLRLGRTSGEESFGMALRQLGRATLREPDGDDPRRIR